MDTQRHPLPDGRLYHFNVIYNHARCPLSQTDDTKLSLNFTESVVSKLESLGFVNSFYHDRDSLPGKNIFTELFRVIDGSEFTIVVLTPGFVKDCWSRYTQMAIFKKLVDDGQSKKFVPVAVGLSGVQLPPELITEHTLHFKEDWARDENSWLKLKRVFVENVPVSTAILGHEPSTNEVKAVEETNTPTDRRRSDNTDGNSLFLNDQPPDLIDQRDNSHQTQSSSDDSPRLLERGPPGIGNHSAGSASREISSANTDSLYDNTPSVDLLRHSREEIMPEPSRPRIQTETDGVQAEIRYQDNYSRHLQSGSLEVDGGIEEFVINRLEAAGVRRVVTPGELQRPDRSNLQQIQEIQNAQISSKANNSRETELNSNAKTGKDGALDGRYDSLQSGLRFPSLNSNQEDGDRNIEDVESPSTLVPNTGDFESRSEETGSQLNACLPAAPAVKRNSMKSGSPSKLDLASTSLPFKIRSASDETLPKPIPVTSAEQQSHVMQQETFHDLQTREVASPNSFGSNTSTNTLDSASTSLPLETKSASDETFPKPIPVTSAEQQSNVIQQDTFHNLHTKEVTSLKSFGGNASTNSETINENSKRSAPFPCEPPLQNSTTVQGRRLSSPTNAAEGLVDLEEQFNRETAKPNQGNVLDYDETTDQILKEKSFDDDDEGCTGNKTRPSPKGSEDRKPRQTDSQKSTWMPGATRMFCRFIGHVIFTPDQPFFV